MQYATDKMPAVGSAIMNAMDFGSMKYQELSFNVTTLMDTPEWMEGSYAQKISLVWDTFVGDPFRGWWDATGQGLCVEYAGKIGNTMGGVLSGGLMVLFGIDISDASGDGMKIGATFVEGFMEGFDFEKVWDGFLGFSANVVKEASKILPGGEEASGLSYLAAGATAYVGSKAYKVGSSVVDVGKGIGSVAKNGWDLGSSFFSKSTSSTTTTNKTSHSMFSGLKNIWDKGSSFVSNLFSKTSKVGSATSWHVPTSTGLATTSTSLAKNGSFLSVGSSAVSTLMTPLKKALSVFDIAWDGFSGTKKAEEWTGSDSFTSKLSSGIAGAIAGTGDGILSFLGNVSKGAGVGGVAGTAVGGPAGTAVGAIGGAVVGGMSSLIGGETIANTLNSAFELINSGLMALFGEDMPTNFGSFISSIRSSFLYGISYGYGFVSGTIMEWWLEHMPTSFSAFFGNVGDFLTTSVEEAKRLATDKTSQFFNFVGTK